MPDISITKTREEPGAKALRVEVPVERVRAAQDKTTAYYARRVKLPGFRKGKVPADVVRKRFHDATCRRVAHAFEKLSGGFPAPPARAGAP